MYLLFDSYVGHHARYPSLSFVVSSNSTQETVTHIQSVFNET